MLRLVPVLLGGLIVGTVYSFIIEKFIRNKFIIFLPTILGVAWILYTVLTFKTSNVEGFYDLAVFLLGLIIFSVILGNTILGIILIKRRANPR